jgi:hypothetical protein
LPGAAPAATLQPLHERRQPDSTPAARAYAVPAEVLEALTVHVGDVFDVVRAALSDDAVVTVAA